jgi:hypothetical protein
LLLRLHSFQTVAFEELATVKHPALPEGTYSRRRYPPYNTLVLRWLW